MSPPKKNYQKSRGLLEENFLNKELNLAEKMYALIWAYQEDLSFEGSKLLNELPDLSMYQGFATYYQELYKYYVKE